MKFATTIRFGNHEKFAGDRPGHREYLTGLEEQGKLFASGPLKDDSSALIFYEAGLIVEAQAMLDTDPFREAGVFQTWIMKPWRQVL
ncbi:MAG TPA: YciI family protein [Thermomicrobiales bacterium]|nr:YciI family protein [Thermomicrobiales bacterium]